MILHRAVSEAAIYFSPLSSYSLEAGSATAKLLVNVYNHNTVLVPPTSATDAELGGNHTDNGSQQDERILPWLLQSRNLERDGVPKVL